MQYNPQCTGKIYEWAQWKWKQISGNKHLNFTIYIKDASLESCGSQQQEFPCLLKLQTWNILKVTTAVLQGKQHLCAQHCTPHHTAEEKGSSFSHPWDFTLCGTASDELLTCVVSSGTICNVSVCCYPVALSSSNSTDCICMNFWLLTFLLFLTLSLSLGRQRTVISVFWALLQQELFYENKTPAQDKDRNIFIGENTTVAKHQELWALWICLLVDLLSVCCPLCWERWDLSGWGSPSSSGSLGLVLVPWHWSLPSYWYLRCPWACKETLCSIYIE